MTPSHSPFLRALLYIVVSILLFQPCLSLARNGDDWVLVERFKAQLKRAQAGNPNAMYEVAHMYERGRGTPPDIHQAVQWFERASAKGQADASAQLGVLYLEGNGVKRSLQKALHLLKPVAETGNATAQYYLGQMYEQGKGVRHDLGQAEYWYRQAAKSGHYLAIDRLKLLARAKEKSRHRQSVASSKLRSRAAKTDSPAMVLMRTVLQAKWQKAGRPSSFLPSASTHCRRQHNRAVTCKSGVQERKTYDAVVRYSTNATLSGFKNADTFEVSYVNTVLKVKPVVRHQLDGSTTTRRPPNIPLGKQSVTHTLRCELKSVNQLVCVKDNNMTDTFTRAK
ncbi:MAG: tetratricopeptide repeat protein [Gammaproteobacteria bacterium]